ncbi:MAG TPA: AmmeMemoRadiSam system protein B, partial [Spirochaetia bacterium]|nr:AmmeMemoRadiSam system protein B [Spirochaetia bacterium]
MPGTCPAMTARAPAAIPAERRRYDVPATQQKYLTWTAPAARPAERTLISGRVPPRRKAMLRSPYAAGAFYPGSASTLKNALDQLIDLNAPKEAAPGILVPHAGYQYSGAVTGAVISRVDVPPTVVIMGPSHSGIGKPFSVMAEGEWQTPLGNVPVDEALARKLIDGSDYLEADIAAHIQEHAVEVQLPFLQYVRPDVAIVPIILTVASPSVYLQIGRDIARTVRDSGQNVLIMASGDMTHYEPDATAREKDLKAVEAMQTLDTDELARRYKNLHITMCAFGPVMACMAAVRELGGTTGELIEYRTSGDATGDRDAVVGYAGVIFKAGAAEDPLVKLARQTVETYVREGRRINPPADLPPEMRGQAGVFVSIHKKGALRGCIGTFEPQEPDIAREIINNA